MLELMIAIGIFAIAMTGIYQTYHSQQKSYLKQEQVVDLQQNLRAGLYFFKKDIRMAGYDPKAEAGATITIARRGELEFEIDQNISGTIGDDAKETVRYALTEDAGVPRDDPAKDGIPDRFPCNLGRQSNLAGSMHTMAENVEALEFCYVLADGTVTLEPADPADVRSLFVSLLVRSQAPLQGFTDNNIYYQASNNLSLTPDLEGTRPSPWGPFNDAYQRRLLVTRIKCRNMGLDPFAD